MIKLILVVVVLTIIMCNPFLLFLGAAVGIVWLLLKQPNSFSWPPTHLAMPSEGEDNGAESNLSRRKKEYPTPEEVYAREVEAKMKPGYKDDPKWQELSKKVCRQVDENNKKAEQEERLEGLTNEVI